MKRTYAVVSLLILFLSILAIEGCKEEHTTQIMSPTGHVLYVYPHHCILYHTAYDTARTWITVAVRDYNNQPVLGIAVDISVADSVNASIRFSNDSLQNTTNEQGEVYLWYITCLWGIENTVTASIQGASDSCQIRDQEYYTPIPELRVTVDPDTLHVSEEEEDSARVEVQLKDGYSTPIAHHVVFLSTNGGSLDNLLPTDSLGKSSTWWHTDGTYGTFYIVAYGPQIIDSTRITVLP